MNGYTDGTFKPNNNITKAEIATIFYHLLDEESRYFYWTEENAFSDVSANDWFNTAVSTMVNAGLMDGEADVKFHPNQIVTRADVAKIIYNFADQNMIFDSFKDVEGHWAKIYILVAAGNGWITGYPDGTFRPDGNVTRAEAVAIINRVLDRVSADQTRLFSNMIR